MNVRHIIQKSLQMIVVAAMFTSCDMMKEDRDDCPTGLYINFVYDYNIQRADMFKDHVGHVTLYVFDEDDRLVAQRSVSGSELSVYGYSMHFTEKELAPDHQYRLTAVAMQTDWNEALTTMGAKYRKTTMNTGDKRQQLSIKLDRLPAKKGTNYCEVPMENTMLDILWHTKQVMEATAPGLPTATRYRESATGEAVTNAIETVTLTRGVPTYATVSMVRDTKHLNISLRELDRPEDVDDDNYEVFIIDANGDLDCENNVVATADSLIYRPYAQWTNEFDAGGEIGVQRSAHYDLMFNRLMYSTTVDDNAVLCIRRKSDNLVVAVINLPYILCQGRTAYEIYNYRPQDYLDREYDYRLEFFLRNDRWEYINVCIDVLSWAKRIQYWDF